MENLAIDLNLDAGESPEALQDGTEEKLYQLVSSVNIACGGHAGDETTMSQAVGLALKYKLQIGAHPSYPDRAGFGRKALQIPAEDLAASLIRQIENLKEVCRKKGAKISHIKPHGALYNVAANDPTVSQAIIKAVTQVDPNLWVVGLSGSQFLEWCKQAGLKTKAEVFADRHYEKDGSLRNRSLPNALIEDPTEAANQALQLATKGTTQTIDGTTVQLQGDTICIHGDTANAFAVATKVRSTLEASGLRIKNSIS